MEDEIVESHRKGLSGKKEGKEAHNKSGSPSVLFSPEDYCIGAKLYALNP